MAADSDGKLTKFESTVTVVTADFANSIFGGLYGSGEASSMDPEDPRIRGHVHDGQNIDGHAPLVNLVEHVEDKLLHENLADQAVHRNNVRETVNVNEAIPESYESGGSTYYYLDLRGIRADLVFVEEDFDGFPPEYTAYSGGPEHPVVRQRHQYWDGSAYVDIAGVWAPSTGLDFVFGSSSLEDINDPGEPTHIDGDNRFLFDKSKGAFRAGGVTGPQWDEDNRGPYSVAFGSNTKAEASFSVVAGGENNLITDTGNGSVIAGGIGNSCAQSINTISGGQANVIGSAIPGDVGSVISGGGGNHVDSSMYGTLSGGQANQVQGNWSTVSGGQNNEIESGSDHSAISGGSDNLITNSNDYSTISGGIDNQLNSSHSTISGGMDNRAKSNYAAISGGRQNRIELSSSHSAISGGRNNIIDDNSEYSAISGGRNNKVIIGSEYATIGGGIGNWAYEYASILGGLNNQAHPQSVVVGGDTNIVATTSSAIVGGVRNNIYANSPFSFIGAGQENKIGSVSEYSIVGGGGGMPGGSQPMEENVIGIDFAFDSIGPPPWSTNPGLWDFTAGGPSPRSGVFGGSGNWIAGGDIDLSGVPLGGVNFVFGGTHNKIAAWTPSGGGQSVYNQYILGGNENIIACTAGSFKHNAIGFGSFNKMKSGEAGIDNCVILGGSANCMETAQAAGAIITHCNILGGWHNEIGFNPNNKGGVLCTVGGGSNNKILTSTSTFAGAGFPSTGLQSETSCFSTILGGFYNSVTDSRGAVICGGGAIVDPMTYWPGSTSSEDVWFNPGTGEPIGLVPASTLLDLNPHSHNPAAGYVGNMIENCHYAGILTGINNVIEVSDGIADLSSIIAGANNHINGAFASSVAYGIKNKIESQPFSNKANAFAGAFGREASSYNYGQKSQAAGTWDLRDGSFAANGFTDGSGDPISGLYASDHGESKPGGAQTFVFTMFGHWDYDIGGIGNTGFKLLLDGDIDKINHGRAFEPKMGSSYTFKIQGVLNCTEAAGGVTKESVHFTYEGGLNCSHTGATMQFGAAPVNMVWTTGPVLINTDASGWGGGITSDFAIYFTNGPLSRNSSGAVAYGPLTGMVENVQMHVGNAPDYINASCVCRVEVTENNLWFEYQ